MSPENLRKWQQWIRDAKPEDFAGEGLPVSEPTDHVPGSWSKVLEMEKRYERREQLFDPAGDALPSDRHGFRGKTLGSEMEHRVALLVETCQGVEEIERRELQKPRERRPSELRPRTPEEKRKECDRKRVAAMRKVAVAQGYHWEKATGQFWFWEPERGAKIKRRKRFLGFRLRRCRGTWDDLFRELQLAA